MLFLEFRPITRGRLRRSRVTFLWLAGAALLGYAFTMSGSAFPGRSAAWIAWASGLDVREEPVRPLLTALGRLAASLPWGTLALRLNALAVIAGALMAGWAYKLVWFLVFEMMREDSAVTHAPRNARFGGMVAAAAVATSLPVWQAATRFGPEIFDAAGLMACAYTLTVYSRSQKIGWLLLFGALCGAGMAESHRFLLAAPFLAAAAVITEWKIEWCRIGRLTAAAAAALLLFVGVHGWAAHGMLRADGVTPDAAALLRVAVLVFRDQLENMTGVFPRQLWFPVLVLGVVSAGLSFFAAFRTLDNRRSWSLLILSVVLTVFAGLMLCNVSFTPWGVMASRGAVPAVTYALSGLGIGLLAASWRALAVLADPLDTEVPREFGEVGGAAAEEEGDAEEEPPPQVFAAGRALALLAVPALCGMIALGAARNARGLVRDRGGFADRAADAALEGLDGRSWIVSNGILDPHLLIRAHEKRIPVRLICPYRAREPRYVARLVTAFANDPSLSERTRLKARSLGNFSLHLFIDDLFAGEQDIGRRAVCMGVPDLWYAAEWTPVPERLFFGGRRSVNPGEGIAALRAHEAFWQAWKPFAEAGDGEPRQLAFRYRKALRQHLSLTANNLGVMLDDLGKPEEAFTAYLQARAFWPENISTLLNLFELVSRGFHPEMKDAVEAQLRRKVENPSDRYGLWSLSRFFGYVRNYGLFVRMGWAWAISSSPGSVLAGLRGAYAVQEDEEKRAALTTLMASVHALRGDYAKSAEEYRRALEHDPRNTAAISGLTRLALQRNTVEDARRILEQGEASGVPERQLRLDWAALYLAAGDLPRARVLLQDLAEAADATPMTLAMLAMVMIEQQESASVEAKLLPKLAKAGSGADAYFAQVIQGRIWQGKGKAGYSNARLCFHRASLLRPDVHALQEVLLKLDVALEDQKAAEAHALTVLRRFPEHPFANYIMGSIRLEQGEYGDAETYLARSVAAPEPALAALNNYAQALCRIRKLERAEAVARQATARAPARYEGWGTLAYVLAVGGRAAEAEEALARARAIQPADPRLCLVDGMLALARGDGAGALRAAAALEAASGLSPADRREARRLRAEAGRIGTAR